MPLYRELASSFLGPDSLYLQDVGEETYSRILAGSQAITSQSQRLRVTYFRARKTEAITQIRMMSGSTAAGAAPTLVRFGIYTCTAAGDGTLAASIANDVTIFAGANTEYLRALTAPLAKVAGQLYAACSLVVTAAAAPTIAGTSTTASMTASYGRSPFMGAFLDGQANLPAAFTLAALTLSNNQVYADLVP
jgi:hypothetical protein